MPEIALGFHSQNTLAIRAAVTAQQKAFVKTVKKGRDKSMAPDPYGMAPGALCRFYPLIISPLQKNFVENNRNGNYHKHQVVDVKTSWCLKRGEFGLPKPVTPFLFSNKKSPLAGGSFILKIFSRFQPNLKISPIFVPLISAVYNSRRGAPENRINLYLIDL